MRKRRATATLTVDRRIFCPQLAGHQGTVARRAPAALLRPFGPRRRRRALTPETDRPGSTPRRQLRRAVLQAGLARPPAAGPRLLPQPLTRPDVGHRRALDQPLAAPLLRAELLGCRFSVGRIAKTYRGESYQQAPRQHPPVLISGAEAPAPRQTLRSLWSVRRYSPGLSDRPQGSGVSVPFDLDG